MLRGLRTHADHRLFTFGLCPWPRPREQTGGPPGSRTFSPAAAEFVAGLPASLPGVRELPASLAARFSVK